MAQGAECDVDKTLERLNKAVHKNACYEAFYGGGLQSAPATFQCDSALFTPGALGTPVRYLPTANTVDYLNLNAKRNSRIRGILQMGTLVFFNMNADDQKKVMRKWPELCERYSNITDKIDANLKIHHPMPEFAIHSCTADNRVSEVKFRYRNGGRGSYMVKRNGNNLSVIAYPPNRRNYELQI